MAGLNEIAKWEREVYQIEEDDPVLGGVEGVTNKPLKHLANRTLYLKQVLEAAGQKLMPKKLTAATRNTADSTGHTHEIDLASTTTKGLVQLTNDTGLDSEVLALTAKAGKAIAQSVAQLQLSTTNALNQKVNKSDISNAVNSTSQTTVASSQAVKTAYDLANSKYTAQDASPTQKGLVQLANNLTTDDATKALTAAQGKILKDEIDGIEIGGRNLIKNSRLLNDTTHWNVIGGRDVRNGIAVLKSLDTSMEWWWRQSFNLPEKQYTFSAEVKPERTAFYIHLQNGERWVDFYARNLTPGIWQKISITFVSAVRQITFVNPREGLVELQNPMLVEGNRAMTWAPALEDLTEEALNSARQNYVAKAGDTMTGNLMINHAVSHVKGQRSGVDTWYVGNESESNQDVILNSYVHDTYIKLKQDRVESNKPLYRGNRLVFDEGNLQPVRQIDLRSHIPNTQIEYQNATIEQLPEGSYVGFTTNAQLSNRGIYSGCGFISKNAEGLGFKIAVNGNRFFAQGANWSGWMSSQEFMMIKPKLMTENLNSIIEPGIYQQNNSNETTIGRSYPVTESGVLWVTSSENSILQEYTTFSGKKFIRSQSNNDWTNWMRTDGGYFNDRVTALFTYQKIGNSEIRKYPDGTMIQTQTGSMNFNSRFAKSNQIFAVAFVEEPIVMLNIKVESDVSANISIISNTGFTIASSDQDKDHFVGQKNWSVIAIGRWK